MRLLTHNLLMCNRKQCAGGFPLRIEVADNPEATLKEDAGNFSVDFVQNILKKLDWDAFRATALSLNMDLPVSYSDSDKTDAEFLQLVYDVALSFHILEGQLVCPKCERVFPISKGIPNMLLHDDEV